LKAIVHCEQVRKQKLSSKTIKKIFGWDHSNFRGV